MLSIALGDVLCKTISPQAVCLIERSPLVLIYRLTLESTELALIIVKTQIRNWFHSLVLLNSS
jgi:hypothetical protein